MKKNVKIVTIIVITLLIVLNAAQIVLADDLGITINKPTDNSLTDIGGKIIGIIQVVGNIIAVGVLVVLGIKYMTASPEGKADYKGTMIPYLVGAVLLFAAVNIANAIYGAVNSTVAPTKTTADLSTPSSIEYRIG